jgi:penicillin-binding protein 1C
MQTVRLMRGNPPRTIPEKMLEALLALRLECRYTKDEILHRYAAGAPFGGNVVGIDAAAWRYFGRSPSELSWAEAATLAVLPNAPALIHPGRNRDQLRQKRDFLLEKLAFSKCISPDDLLLSKAEPLPEQPLPLPAEAPHLLERMAKTNPEQINRTTILYDLQCRANEIIARHAIKHRGNQVNNIAAVIIENESHHVLAYIGNAPAAPHASQGEMVDIIPAHRSAGSILKPFLYAAMLDDGRLLPSMLIPDIPTFINGFVPQNYLRTYDGAVEADRALARSLNIPAVILLQDYSVARFHHLLHRIGFTSITNPPHHYGLSLILGGAEVSLYETTNAYASLARTLNHFSNPHTRYLPSQWSPPILLISSSKDIISTHKANGSRLPTSISSSKDIISTHKANGSRLPFDAPLSAAAIWQILSALSESDRPEGEIEWHRFHSSRKIAWKTGTSFGNRDAWAVGITPQYTIGVWVGNASGEGRPVLTGIQAAAPVLFDLFNLLPHTSWFIQPFDEMIKVPLCQQSGHRATDLCPLPDTAWILNAGLESRPCPFHLLVHLDRTQRYRVTADCEDPHHIISKSWFLLPPAQELYYKTRHYNYIPLPPRHPACPHSDTRPSMALLYPQHNFHILLTRQMDGSIGRLIMQATHHSPDATIFWHLDNQYIGLTAHPHQMPVLPAPGPHTITLVDNEGFTISSKCYVDK